MYGMDISNYQRKIDLSLGNYDFCIIKATEGIFFIDQSFSNYAVQLTKLNKLIGCYHYARPDYHGTVEGMRNEAEHFVKTLMNEELIGKSILVLDWETEPMDREDLVSAWLEKVVELTGVIPFIYGSKSKFNQWASWETLKKYPLWVAQWPTINRIKVGEKITYKEPVLKVENYWEIWQYSSAGIYPNFSGMVDLDYTAMTKEVWKFYCEAHQKGTAPDTESVSDDMQWAIDIGLFSGYQDGTYREDEPLTRGQAASLFRRYTTILNNKVV